MRMAEQHRRDTLARQWVRHPGKPLREQAQALVTQAMMNAKLLPRKTVKALLPSLGPVGVVRNYVDHFVAALLGLGRTTVRSCYHRMASNGFMPQPPRPVGRKRQAKHIAERVAVGPEAQQHAMLVHVRECLAISFYGQPDIEYERALRRMELAGVHVGTRNRSKKFVGSWNDWHARRRGL